MAYTSGFTAVTGATFTAAQYNTNVRDNFSAIWVYTTAGDIVYATSATTLTRLGIGAEYQQLRVASGGSTLEWAGVQKCEIYKTATQNVSTSSETSITWDTEASDSRGWHSTSVNTERITVTSSDWYLPSCNISFTRAGGSGTFECRIQMYINGTVTPNRSTQLHYVDANKKYATVGGIPVYMSATNYIYVTMWQDSGGTCTVYGTDSTNSYFSLLRLG